MMFYYATPPQDFFQGMVHIDDYVKSPTADILGVIEAAMLAATHFVRRWEGDIRSREFYVFALPDPLCTSVRLGLVWKQDNNGDTFIASPTRLDWLDDYLIPTKD